MNNEIKENEKLKTIKPCMLNFQECYVVKDYKLRCEKAIEYIEKHFEDDEGIICKITGKMECETNYNFLDDLLNILQNGGDNNE